MKIELTEKQRDAMLASGKVNHMKAKKNIERDELIERFATLLSIEKDCCDYCVFSGRLNGCPYIGECSCESGIKQYLMKDYTPERKWNSWELEFLRHLSKTYAYVEKCGDSIKLSDETGLLCETISFCLPTVSFGEDNDPIDINAELKKNGISRP